MKKFIVLIFLSVIFCGAINAQSSNTVTCYACERIVGPIFGISQNKYDVTLFSGILVNQAGKKWLVHHPYSIVAVNMNYISVRDRYGNEANLTTKNTQFNTLAEILNYLEDCVCTTASTSSGIDSVQTSNDTMFIFSGADTFTVVIPPASISADNAITENTPNNVQLGGELIHNTTIAAYNTDSTFGYYLLISHIDTANEKNNYTYWPDSTGAFYTQTERTNNDTSRLTYLYISEGGDTLRLYQSYDEREITFYNKKLEFAGRTLRLMNEDTASNVHSGIYSITPDRTGLFIFDSTLTPSSTIGNAGFYVARNEALDYAVYVVDSAVDNNIAVQGSILQAVQDNGEARWSQYAFPIPSAPGSSYFLVSDAGGDLVWDTLGNIITADQNLFNIVTSTGEDPIIATSPTDQLNLLEGIYMDIMTDSSFNSVVFSVDTSGLLNDSIVIATITNNIFGDTNIINNIINLIGDTTGITYLYDTIPYIDSAGNADTLYIVDPNYQNEIYTDGSGIRLDSNVFHWWGAAYQLPGLLNITPLYGQTGTEDLAIVNFDDILLQADRVAITGNTLATLRDDTDGSKVEVGSGVRLITSDFPIAITATNDTISLTGEAVLGTVDTRLLLTGSGNASSWLFDDANQEIVLNIPIVQNVGNASNPSVVITPTSKPTNWVDTRDAVILGQYAGFSANSTGLNGSIFIGAEAGYNSTSSNSLAIGQRAGYAALSGLGNAYIGYLSGRWNTNGDNNIYIGSQSGAQDNSSKGITDGDKSILIGVGVGGDLQGVSKNLDNAIWLGFQAGKLASSWEDNSIFIGSSAGEFSNFDASTQTTQTTFDGAALNVFIGGGGVASNQRGHANIFVGPTAGKYSNIRDDADNIEDRNIGIGSGVAEYLEGENNVTFGYRAGNQLKGEDNFIGGALTGESVIGNYNSVIGSNSATFTGDENIVIGRTSFNTQPPGTNTSDTLVISVKDGDRLYIPAHGLSVESDVLLRDMATPPNYRTWYVETADTILPNFGDVATVATALPFSTAGYSAGDTLLVVPDIDNTIIIGSSIDPTASNEIWLGNSSSTDFWIGQTIPVDLSISLGAGQDEYVWTYDDDVGKVIFKAAPGAGGGMTDWEMDVNGAGNYAIGDLDVVNLASGEGVAFTYSGADPNHVVTGSLDINGLSNSSLTIADADLFAIYDATTDTRVEKIRYDSLVSALEGDLTIPGVTDDQTVDTFEIQAGSLVLTLEDDNEAPYSVDLSAYLDNTDDQTLTVDGTTQDTIGVTIESGNTVYFISEATVLTLSELVNDSILFAIDIDLSQYDNSTSAFITTSALSGYFNTAGTGLTSSGSTVNANGGNGIDVTADSILTDFTELLTEGSIADGDYLVMHDAITPNDGKILWEDVVSTLIVTELPDWFAEDSHSYLTVTNENPELDAERALVAGTGLASVDGGANGSFTLSTSFDELNLETAIEAGDWIIMRDVTGGTDSRLLYDSLVSELNTDLTIPGATDDQTIDVSTHDATGINISLEDDGEATKVIPVISTDANNDIIFSTDGVYLDVGTASIETVSLAVYNNSGAEITKGTPVYQSGWNGGTSEITIAEADADDAAKMPAIGLVTANISNNSSGTVITTGILENFNTSAFSSGDPFYVSTTVGELSTKPTGATSLIQKMGIVLFSNVSTGDVIVLGAGRSNDVPNIAEDYLWVGNASGVATATNLVGGTQTLITVSTSAGNIDFVVDNDLSNYSNATSNFFDAAGTGATSTGSTINVVGGEGILANADNLELDINGLANSSTTLGNADLFAFYDATTDTRVEKITYANLLTELNTDLTIPGDDLGSGFTLDGNGAGNVQQTIQTALTVNGVASVDVDNAIGINAEAKATDVLELALNEEVVEDIIGVMVTGNTETAIAVTYQEDGTLDFIVDVTGDWTGTLDGSNAADFATTELDNLGTTAINADLIPNGTIDLGTDANEFTDLWVTNISHNSASSSLTIANNDAGANSHIYLQTGAIANEVRILNTNFRIDNSAGNSQGVLYFDEDRDNGTDYTGIQSAANVTEAGTYTLPAADGSANQVLQTDGSFGLSWASNAATVTLEEDNSPATPTSASTFDFQEGFDLADGTGEVDISIDLSEFTSAQTFSTTHASGITVSTTANNGPILIDAHGTGDLTLDQNTGDLILLGTDAGTAADYDGFTVPVLNSTVMETFTITELVQGSHTVEAATEAYTPNFEQHPSGSVFMDLGAAGLTSDVTIGDCTATMVTGGVYYFYFTGDATDNVTFNAVFKLAGTAGTGVGAIGIDALADNIRVVVTCIYDGVADDCTCTVVDGQ